MQTAERMEFKPVEFWIDWSNLGMPGRRRVRGYAVRVEGRDEPRLAVHWIKHTGWICTHWDTGRRVGPAYPVRSREFAVHWAVAEWDGINPVARSRGVAKALRWFARSVEVTA